DTVSSGVVDHAGCGGGCIDDMPQWAVMAATERIAGGQRQVLAGFGARDRELVPAHDTGTADAVALCVAVDGFNGDNIADVHILQETEMRISVRGYDGGAGRIQLSRRR